MIGLLKLLTVLFLFLTGLVFTTEVYAESFVSIVNPVRGSEFWSEKDQQPNTVVNGQISQLKKNNLPVTWLIRFDALSDSNLITPIKNSGLPQEVGLLLEITPKLTDQSGVKYHQSASWHSAGSVFLSGYSPEDRKKIIDKSFETFRRIFGFYPRSVGAWWIDAQSLEYMQKKYDLTGALIVADQYSTDDYQIWGQYWGMPYYPTKLNALTPAQTVEDRIPVVISQWAVRDPVNGYGSGVVESTYSVQANDYIDYHQLDINYFAKLIDIYTKQPYNQYGFIVVGLENTYSWDKYQSEYGLQLQTLVDKKRAGQLSIVTLNDFNNWYIRRYPNISPKQIIVADDPLGTSKKTVWFMNPYYRAGWFSNNEGSVMRDVRQYLPSQKELCYDTACSSINFATFATRVLDDVTYRQRKVIDLGSISDLKFSNNESFDLIYKNAAGVQKSIRFLPRDIAIDQQIRSIDSFILEAVQTSPVTDQPDSKINGGLKQSLIGQFGRLGIFAVFVLVAFLIPGLSLTNRIFNGSTPLSVRMLTSLVSGITVFTLISFVAGLIKIPWSIWIYIIAVSLPYLIKRSYRDLSLPKWSRIDKLAAGVIALGSIFLILPTFKSGLLYDFGIGFWGPNGHDGVWHLSLINQLMTQVPPANPILAGTQLQNYHYFYDLLVAFSSVTSHIPVVDLLFRFYPLLFSLLLGLGAYVIVRFFTSSAKAIVSSLWLVYFAGSFGWIVEFIHQKHFGGESAFWVNQPISANLNPPFISSLLIVITVVAVLLYAANRQRTFQVVLIALLGGLLTFKAYAALLVFPALAIVSLVEIIYLKRWTLFVTTLLAGMLTIAIVLANNYQLSSVFIWQPWWFIETMIDSPDRVGWARLSLTRTVGLETENYLKYFAAQGIGLLIFIVGNLGIRIFGLGVIGRDWKYWLKEPGVVLMVVITFLAMTIPLLFIQKGTAWNVVQFFYYAVFFWAIAGGISLGKLPVALIGLLLLIAPINAAVTANSYLVSSPHALISQSELAGLDFLKKQPQGIVLTYPYDKNLKNRLPEPWPLLAYETSSYVSAFGEHPTFIEDQIQQDILADVSAEKRLIGSLEFFRSQNSQWSKEFLVTSKINYIYLPKIYQVSLPDIDGLKPIFDNDSVVLYAFDGEKGR